MSTQNLRTVRQVGTIRRIDRHVGDLQVIQGVDEAHFFLSDANSISLGSPVSASPAAA
jgi:hypothetical protein